MSGQPSWVSPARSPMPNRWGKNAGELGEFEVNSMVNAMVYGGYIYIVYNIYIHNIIYI